MRMIRLVPLRCGEFSIQFQSTMINGDDCKLSTYHLIILPRQTLTHALAECCPCSKPAVAVHDDARPPAADDSAPVVDAVAQAAAFVAADGSAVVVVVARAPADIVLAVVAAGQAPVNIGWHISCLE